MKKLMTMLAAAVVAVGAFAEAFETGTAFSFAETTETPIVLSGATIQELILIGDPATAAESGYWAGLNDDVKVTAFNGGAPAQMQRFKDADFEHINYLTVKTTLGNPVLRYAQTNAVPYSLNEVGAAQIYFQGNVKFTAFDEEPSATYMGAKILLYVKDLSQFETPSAETNLYAKVGGKEYKVASGIDIDAWHTLTIKTMKIADSQLGFVVFLGDEDTDVLSADKAVEDLPTDLDPVAQYYASKNQLFPAGATGTTITEVGFDGQGSVDQIAFSTKELIPDPDVVSVKFENDTQPEFVTAVSTNGVPLTLPAIVEKGVAVVVTVDPDSAYMDKTYSNVQSSLEIKATEFDTAAAKFNGTKYAALTGENSAVAEANASEVDGTLTLLADATAGITIQNANNKVITLDLGGKNVTDTTAIKAKSDVVITNSIAGGAVTGKVISDRSGELLKITAGTFDGTVDADGGDGDIEIWGGKFLASANKDLADSSAEIKPAGKTLIPEEGETGYLVVGDPIVTTWTATVAPAGDNVTLVSITTNDVAVVNPVAAGDYTINAGDEVVVTYELDEGYKLATGSAELEQTLSDAEGMRASVSPTAELQNFTLTVPECAHTTVTVTYGDITDTTNGVYTLPYNTYYLVKYVPVAGYMGGMNASGNIFEDTELKPMPVNPINYKITFATDRGTAPEDIPYTVESPFPIALPTITDVTGATFLGWTNETYTTATNSIDELPSPLANIALVAAWEVFVDPVRKEIDEKVTDVPTGKEAEVYDNMQTLIGKFDDAAAADAWIVKIYGDAKIPGAKLAATDANLIAMSVAYDLPILGEEPTVAFTAGTTASAFEFKLMDGANAVPLAQAACTAKIQDMIEFTADLSTTPFAKSTAADVEVAIKPEADNCTAVATFQKATPAGFMRVNLKGAE